MTRRSQPRKWHRAGRPTDHRDLPLPLAILLAWSSSCPSELRAHVRLLDWEEGRLVLGVDSEESARGLCDELPAIQRRLDALLARRTVERVEIRRLDREWTDEATRPEPVPPRPPIGKEGLRAPQELPEGELRQTFERLVRKHRDRFGGSED